MSQAVQRGVLLLAVLLFITAGIAVFAWYQRIDLQQKNQNLQHQLADVQVKLIGAVNKSQKLQQDANDLTQRLDNTQKEKDKLQNDFGNLKARVDSLITQADQAGHERDNWKNRLETIRKERDELIRKLQSRSRKVVSKEQATSAAAAVPAVPSDAYWAGVLKAKAGLEVELDKARADLDKGALQVADLRKQNSDLQLQIKELSNDKEDIDRRLSNEKKEMIMAFEREKYELQRKIKDGENLANNLSMEAARARSEQKSDSDFTSKIKDDNRQLQTQARQLVSTKVALERTVARLTQEKADMSQKLAATEGVIQDRINEVWQIKKNLDEKISQINDIKSNNKEVELPPIVVNATGQGLMNQVHKIISVNEKDNFVIIDYGSVQGSSIGRIFKAYRDGKEIATLVAIQVRRDISAADIKNAQDKLQVGDQVR